MIDWARQLENKPDLIIGGHTHQYVNAVENGIHIVQAASYSTRYSVTDLVKEADGSTRAWVRGVPYTYVDQITPDTAIAALVAGYVRTVGPDINRTIAELESPLHKSADEYALGRLIADAQRAATGSQIAVMNNGGIRTELDAGAQTWGELYQLQPFANLLVVLHLTGAQVREFMEFLVRGAHPGMHVSGITVMYDTTRAPGSRVVRMQLANGEDIKDSGTYTVTVNDFMAAGGDNLTMIMKPVGRVDTGIVDLDALITYLQKQPQPVRGPAERRFIAR
jgi:5'-nucleotidase